MPNLFIHDPLLPNVPNTTLPISNIPDYSSYSSNMKTSQELPSYHQNGAFSGSPQTISSAMQSKLAADNRSKAQKRLSTSFEEDDSEYASVNSTDDADEDDEGLETELRPRSKGKAVSTIPNSRRTSGSNFGRAIASKSTIGAKGTASTTTMTFTDLMDAFEGGYAEACALKAKLPQISITKGQSTGRRGREPVEQDSENHLIMKLRTEENHSWAAITEVLNKERIKAGGDPNWTQAAVYSRFTRNGPGVAELQGNASFEGKENMHMKTDRKKPGRARTTALPSLGRQSQLHLLQAYEEAREDFWSKVAEKMWEKTGRQWTAEECAQFYAKI